ncbi:PDZ domain-containing protein [Candidatus Laterigemmans baculatus]|uniref:PDZ domain-containing protein n=1 Tax=Candidatus Laterigemmans baculatus TaxID=2770505 RepID=UPI0036F36C39
MRSGYRSGLLFLSLGVLGSPFVVAQDDSQDQLRQEVRAEQRATQERRDQEARRERDRRDRMERMDRERRDRERQGKQRSSRGRVTGEVVQAKRVDVRGTDRQHLVVLLKTERGARVPVDLGELRRLGAQPPQVGDTIKVRGRLVQIGDRHVVVGEDMEGRDRRLVRIEPQSPRVDHERDRVSRERGDRSGQRDVERSTVRRPTLRGSRRAGRGGLGVALATDRGGGGVRVVGVMRGSPAAEAGITPGDVIISVDDSSVLNPRELMRMVVLKEPGEQINVRIRRDGETRLVTPRIETREEALDSSRRSRERASHSR